MARPQRCRKVSSEPEYKEFLPDGILSREDVILTVDEYEVIRLVDLEKKTHEETAKHMDISRTTVTEIYDSARSKIADSIINGKKLIISGGSYKVCHTLELDKNNIKKGEDIMRIAVTFENDEVFQHFGHTEKFKVYEVNNGKVVSSQVLSTNGSGHSLLVDMLKNLQVDTLICGGIGGGAQNALNNAGIKFFGGVSGNADQAVNMLLQNKLDYNPDVKCSHHDSHHDENHVCGEHGCGQHNCK